MKALVRLTVIAILYLPMLAQAQTPVPIWVKVATEADTLTANKPITVRYGTSSGMTAAGVDCSKSSCWVTVPLQSALNLNLSDVKCCVFGVPDPAPGLAKELDVEQDSAAVTVTVSGKPVTVPALSRAAATYNFTCTFQVSVPNGAPLPTTLTVTNVSCLPAVRQP
jgi:hypothetical protein